MLKGGIVVLLKLSFLLSVVEGNRLTGDSVRPKPKEEKTKTTSDSIGKHISLHRHRNYIYLSTTFFSDKITILRGRPLSLLEPSRPLSHPLSKKVPGDPNSGRRHVSVWWERAVGSFCIVEKESSTIS